MARAGSGAGVAVTQRLCTLKEAAERLRCSVATVKRRIRVGTLPSFVSGAELDDLPRPS